MLVFFFFVAFAAAGYCPFKPELQNNVVFAPPPPLCNVSLLGDGLCACFGNNHCAGGCGCLVQGKKEFRESLVIFTPFFKKKKRFLRAVALQNLVPSLVFASAKKSE